MFYTGLDPYTLKEVYVPRSDHEKAMQRALLQYFVPKNKDLVIAALKAAGRTDLIGTDARCLVRPNAEMLRAQNNLHRQNNNREKQKKWSGKKVKRR